MNVLVSEAVVYVIKFICMILCAGLGIGLGMIIKKRKDRKVAEENTQEQ